MHRTSLSPQSLSQPTSTVQNQIPYATGSWPLIGFTHQHGFRAVIGCSLRGPHRLRGSVVCSRPSFFNGQKQLPAAHRTSRDVPRTWSGGNLGLRVDGINISTSAIVVMFLHWQISVSCESKLPWGKGMEKSKTCRGKTLADWEMKTIPGEGKIDERLKGEESGTKGT